MHIDALLCIMLMYVLSNSIVLQRLLQNLMIIPFCYKKTVMGVHWYDAKRQTPLLPKSHQRDQWSMESRSSCPQAAQKPGINMFGNVWKIKKETDIHIHKLASTPGGL